MWEGRINVRSQGHQGMFCCGKQGALAVVQHGPVFQRREQIEVSLLLKVMGAMQGGLKGAAAALAPGKSKNNAMLRSAAAREVPSIQGLCQDNRTLQRWTPGPGTGFVPEPCCVGGTRELGWVCEQQQGNKTCLSLCSPLGHACVRDWGAGELPQQPGTPSPASGVCFPELTKSAVGLGWLQAA